MRLFHDKRIASLFALIAVIIYVGCASEPNRGGISTDTGNPIGLDNVAYDLWQEICSKLFFANPIACFSTLTVENCVAAAATVTTIDSEVGLSPGQYANFEDVILAVHTSDLEAQESPALTCISAISQLTCDDPEVQNSYDPNFPQELNQVTHLLSTESESCPDIF